MILFGFAIAMLVFLAGLPVTILGYPLVAIGLLFAQSSGLMFAFTQYPLHGYWRYTDLPAILQPWRNTFDGFRGDKRGWWANYCWENYGLPVTAWRSMFMWYCRNPANYWSRVMTGIDASRCTITKLAGNDDIAEAPGLRQWQLLIAQHDNGLTYPRFFCSLAYPWWPDKAVMIDIGWKIKLKHSRMSPDADIKDRIRGSVFTPSPWKSLS